MIAKPGCFTASCCEQDETRADDLAFPTLGVDRPRLERAVREILLALGEDPDRDGLIETPARVARSYADLLRGMHEDAATHLARVFEHEAGADDLVLVRDIDFSSMCEHHLLPFYGKAHVAYLPSGGRVVGLSKLARVVDVFARRPQLQERMTSQVADAIVEHLAPRAVAVVVSGTHMCMKLRGALKQDSSMVTTAFRGEYATDRAARAELMAMIGRP
jgi:GTP cyclohydrolase I